MGIGSCLLQDGPGERSWSRSHGRITGFNKKQGQKLIEWSQKCPSASLTPLVQAVLLLEDGPKRVVGLIHQRDIEETLPGSIYTADRVTGVVPSRQRGELH